MDWIHEKPENEICLKFGIGEGYIHSTADIPEWIMHVTAQLSRLLELKGVKEASELENRIRYGAAPELMDLVSTRLKEAIASTKKANRKIDNALKKLSKGKL